MEPVTFLRLKRFYTIFLTFVSRRKSNLSILDIAICDVCIHVIITRLWQLSNNNKFNFVLVHGCGEAAKKNERKQFLHPKPAKTIKQEEELDKAKKKLQAKLKDMQVGRMQKTGGDVPSSSSRGGGGASRKKKGK